MERTYPPRLKSEYERVVEKYGPPIVPPTFPQHLDLRACCNQQWTLRRFLPTVEKWAAIKQEAPRYWPVLAFAVDQYVFLSDQRNKDGALSVADVVDGLTLISDGASKLARGITRFSQMATALASNRIDIDRIAQIDQLFDRLTTNALDVTPPDLKDPLALIGHDVLIKSFSLMVKRIGCAAKDEAKNIKRDGLRGKRGGSDPALARLVSMAKPIWTGLTNRQPSVHRVRSGAIPDFVQFVQRLVKISGKKPPSPRQVSTAFESVSPRKR